MRDAQLRRVTLRKARATLGLNEGHFKRCATFSSNERLLGRYSQFSLNEGLIRRRAARTARDAEPERKTARKARDASCEGFAVPKRTMTLGCIRVLWIRMRLVPKKYSAVPACCVLSSSVSKRSRAPLLEALVPNLETLAQRKVKYPRVDLLEAEDQLGQAIREDTRVCILKAFPKLFPSGTGDYHADHFVHARPARTSLWNP